MLPTVDRNVVRIVSVSIMFVCVCVVCLRARLVSAHIQHTCAREWIDVSLRGNRQCNKFSFFFVLAKNYWEFTRLRHTKTILEACSILSADGFCLMLFFSIPIRSPFRFIGHANPCETRFTCMYITYEQLIANMLCVYTSAKYQYNKCVGNFHCGLCDARACV